MIRFKKRSSEKNEMCPLEFADIERERPEIGNHNNFEADELFADL